MSKFTRKYFVISLVVLSFFAYEHESKAQTKESEVKICSSLTDSELQEKFELSDSGLGRLHEQDGDLYNKNKKAIYFKLTGQESITSSVEKIVNFFKGVMSDAQKARIEELFKLFKEPQQFFEMTETKVSRVQNGGASANLWVVFRPLPTKIRPDQGESHYEYYPKYGLACTLKSSPTELNCKHVKTSQNFMLDDFSFVVKNLDRTSYCDQKSSSYKSTVQVKYKSVINKTDFNKLLIFISKELLNISTVPSIVTNLINPNDMSDDMMNEYLIKFYSNWTK